VVDVTTVTTSQTRQRVESAASRGERLRIVLLLGSLIAIGPLTIDMYLPALPAITEDLDSGPTAAQLTLTGTLAGLAFGQLLVGPLSDAVGRRRPLLAGLGVHVVASLLCAVAPTMAVLGLFRVLQGFGVAAASVVATAVLRDLFSGNAFARLLSRLLLVMGAAPVLAPTLGGWLLEWTRWPGVFVALAGAGLALTAVAALALRETLPPERRRPVGLRPTVRTYADLLRDRTFLGLTAVAALPFGSLFAYVSGSSFVLQGQYGLDEQQFALAFAAGAAGLIGGSQFNAWLLQRYRSQAILVVSLSVGAIAGLLLLGLSVTGTGGLAAVLAALWVVLAATGVAMPNAPALAMSRHGEAAGTAAALLGAAQFGLGAVTAPVVGLLGADGVAMATVIAGTLGIAAVTMLLMSRRARFDATGAVVVAH
jgi:DHA1 family bicyclomycin/chloramphenicol resistance-like MFS transporter